jgi:hypothetical protein
MISVELKHGVGSGDYHKLIEGFPIELVVGHFVGCELGLHISEQFVADDLFGLFMGSAFAYQGSSSQIASSVSP